MRHILRQNHDVYRQTDRYGDLIQNDWNPHIHSFGSAFIWGLEEDLGVLIVFLGKLLKCTHVLFKTVFIKKTHFQ